MENLRLGAKIGLKWVFIPFLIILLMSHNTFALTLTENVKLQSVYSTGLTVIGPNISYTNVTSASGGTTGAGIETFRLHFNNASCVPGDIYQVNVNFFNTNQNDSLDAWASSLYGGDNDFSFIETEYQQMDAGTGQISFTLACTSTFNNSNKYLTLNSATGSAIWLYPQEWITTFYVARYKVLNTDVDAHEIAENAYEINQKIDEIIDALNHNSDALDTVNESIENINNDVEDATQDASDAAEDAANDNSSNAASTNLVGVLSSFLQAITNFSATDCNIVLNFPSYAGGTMTFNVCQYKDKAGNLISVFTSLTLIVFYLPLAIKLLSMIYNEIRSFTNG